MASQECCHRWCHPSCAGVPSDAKLFFCGFDKDSPDPCLHHTAAGFLATVKKYDQDVVDLVHGGPQSSNAAAGIRARAWGLVPVSGGRGGGGGSSGAGPSTEPPSQQPRHRVKFRRDLRGKLDSKHPAQDARKRPAPPAGPTGAAAETGDPPSAGPPAKRSQNATGRGSWGPGVGADALMPEARRQAPPSEEAGSGEALTTEAEAQLNELRAQLAAAEGRAAAKERRRQAEKQRRRQAEAQARKAEACGEELRAQLQAAERRRAEEVQARAAGMRSLLSGLQVADLYNKANQRNPALAGNQMEQELQWLQRAAGEAKEKWRAAEGREATLRVDLAAATSAEAEARRELEQSRNEAEAAAAAAAAAAAKLQAKLAAAKEAKAKARRQLEQSKGEAETAAAVAAQLRSDLEAAQAAEAVARRELEQSRKEAEATAAAAAASDASAAAAAIAAAAQLRADVEAAQVAEAEARRELEQSRKEAEATAAAATAVAAATAAAAADAAAAQLRADVEAAQVAEAEARRELEQSRKEAEAAAATAVAAATAAAAADAAAAQLRADVEAAQAAEAEARRELEQSRKEAEATAAAAAAVAAATAAAAADAAAAQLRADVEAAQAAEAEARRELEQSRKEAEAAAAAAPASGAAAVLLRADADAAHARAQAAEAEGSAQKALLIAALDRMERDAQEKQRLEAQIAELQVEGRQWETLFQECARINESSTEISRVLLAEKNRLQQEVVRLQGTGGAQPRTPLPREQELWPQQAQEQATLIAPQLGPQSGPVPAVGEGQRGGRPQREPRWGATNPAAECSEPRTRPRAAGSGRGSEGGSGAQAQVALGPPAPGAQGPDGLAEDTEPQALAADTRELPLLGVTRAAGGRFRAAMWLQSKTTTLGTFDTPEEAARAFGRAAVQRHNEGLSSRQLQLNFPSEWSDPRVRPVVPRVPQPAAGGGGAAPPAAAPSAAGTGLGAEEGSGPQPMEGLEGVSGAQAAGAQGPDLEAAEDWGTQDPAATALGPSSRALWLGALPHRDLGGGPRAVSQVIPLGAQRTAAPWAPGLGGGGGVMALQLGVWDQGPPADYGVVAGLSSAPAPGSATAAQAGHPLGMEGRAGVAGLAGLGSDR
ncbi:hypothetical protein HYH03_002303 [Edaphochlamys debaryana]|uniref:AP2/ERF domain-containing protein n=1 Tax=Edaphochlamys debaryana TaxID=47281 RepID=A0A836C5T0_9CHLO|nr:hypothetical protein HYH03_002303 [Edaphochlamys debaryana]|eukprot:KAG2500022.1 hypothetical protein HYH03_002303 [Edaphochlamys debaryana]